MANFEETITETGWKSGISEETHTATQQTINNEDSSKAHTGTAEGNTWKRVTMAGVTGILLGTGSAFGANALGRGAEEPEPEEDPNGLKVAEVSDDSSFGAAYAAAREQVGPGGVFHWRGGIYSTYSEDEWNDMSTEEKNQFAQMVAPEVRAGEGDADHYTAHSSSHTTTTHTATTANGDDDGVEVETTSDGVLAETDDVEVQILGVHDVEIDGQTVTVGTIVADDENVYVIDVNQDGTFDYATADLNHNGQMDANEVEDISALGLRVDNLDHSAGTGLDDGMSMASMEDDGIQAGADDGMFSI